MQRSRHSPGARRGRRFGLGAMPGRHLGRGLVLIGVGFVAAGVAHQIVFRIEDLGAVLLVTDFEAGQGVHAGDVLAMFIALAGGLSGLAGLRELWRARRRGDGRPDNSAQGASSRVDGVACETSAASSEPTGAGPSRPSAT